MQALVLLAIVLVVLVLARYVVPKLWQDLVEEDPECRRNWTCERPMPPAYRPMIPSGIEHAAKELTR